jgi:hypothetical protein
MVGDRIALKAVSREVMSPLIDESQARPTDLIELPPTPVQRKLFLSHDSGELFSLYGPSARQSPMPAEVCYLTKQRPDKQFNSYDKLGDVAEQKPEPLLMPKYRTPNYRNGRVIAVEYLRRSRPILLAREDL